MHFLRLSSSNNKTSQSVLVFPDLDYSLKMVSNKKCSLVAAGKSNAIYVIIPTEIMTHFSLR